ncbi:cation:proton antiporter [Photobacterium sp. J15]|uniref:cation:proton antiporter n=1 Tax=Photobacterium sp. J15 TaxID=265901 RepID=UPI0018DBD0C2|nr:cation:proton antiporter [Photobacterium sp. J15]
MPHLVAAMLLMLVTGFLIKLLQQPHVIAYLIAGIVIGPWGLSLISDIHVISRIGAMGVILLLFFVGMETDARQLVSNWKLSLFGTVVQIGLSVLSVWILGALYDWSFERILLIGFVISLSSTAVVIKLLQDSSILKTKVGQAVLGVLLAQDLAIIPMLIALGILGSDEVNSSHLMLQGAGGLLAGGFFAFLVLKKQVHLPLSRWLMQDHELQLFAAMNICFGLALITAWFDLSTALGAFLAGMLINAAKETQWVHHTLDSFRVMFVSVFFVSVGMLLDIGFLIDNLLEVLALVLLALLTNTFINAFILKISDYSWTDSLYAGVLLSQIGEFSFVLSAVGLQIGLISDYGYQLAICVIAVSLLVSPFWINAGKKLLNWNDKDEHNLSEEK